MSNWFLGRRGEAVTIVRRTVSGQDAYGNDVYAETQIVVQGVALWLGSGTGGGKAGLEDIRGRDTVTIDLTAIMPPGTVVYATDRVLARGDLYEVVGTPVAWVSPLTGADGGVEAALRRVTG